MFFLPCLFPYLFYEPAPFCTQPVLLYPLLYHFIKIYFIHFLKGTNLLRNKLTPIFCNTKTFFFQIMFLFYLLNAMSISICVTVTLSRFHVRGYCYSFLNKNLFRAGMCLKLVWVVLSWTPLIVHLNSLEVLLRSEAEAIKIFFNSKAMDAISCEE